MNPPFAVRKIGHAVIFVSDIERSKRFYTEVLGFQISDIYDGSMMPGGMVFLRCNGDHHCLALVGDRPADAKDKSLHHLAFELATLDEVFRARDHLKKHGARLVADAVFLSGLRKIVTAQNGTEQEVWRPKYVFNYLQDKYLTPTFVIDITKVMEQKIDAVKAYGTQFHNPDLDEPQTYISTPDFMDSVFYRAKMLGKMIGVTYAEGFISNKMIGFESFDPFIKQNT